MVGTELVLRPNFQCVDYRALNKMTVQDRFPILLHGSEVYTKWGLRLGYHQIRIQAEDIQTTTFCTHEVHYEFLVQTTTFRTHEVHYEFLVMSNAPFTFQSLMNDVFRPFMRKFVLVFFHDNLIYSKNLSNHLQLLKTILEVMQTH